MEEEAKNSQKENLKFSALTTRGTAIHCQKEQGMPRAEHKQIARSRDKRGTNVGFAFLQARVPTQDPGHVESHSPLLRMPAPTAFPAPFFLG